MGYKINEDLYIGNTNKQLKDLLVTVHDAYSTSTTDTYSCNYINELGLGEYSTTEKIVGKWINGKPIYRKVLNIGTVTSQKSYITHNIANLGKLVNLYGTYNRNDNAQQTMPGNYTNWETYLYDVTSTEISIYFSNNQWNKNPYDIVVIMEYTKTTD